MRNSRADNDTGASMVATLLVTMLILAMLGAMLTYVSGNFLLLKASANTVQTAYDVDGALKTAMTNAETSGIDPVSHRMNCPDIGLAGLTVTCEVSYAPGSDPGDSAATGDNGTVSPTNVTVNLHPGDTYTVPTPKTVQVPSLNEVIEVPTTTELNPEVFFLADTTCSMQDALNDVSDASGQITDMILAKSDTAKFGVGEYRDTDTGWGSSPRNPYRVNTTPMLTTAAAARTAMDAWSQASCGADTPEDNLAALYQVANNWTVSTDPNVKRVLVWFGDAPGWEDSRYSVGGSKVSRDRLFNALDAKDIQVISISIHSAHYPFPEDHADPDPYWGLNVDLNAHPNPPAVPTPTEGSARLASAPGESIDIAATTRPTVDGVLVNDGDEILLKNQALGAQNGVYTASSGFSWSCFCTRWSWARIGSANANGELAIGSWVRVTTGSQAGDWSVTSIGGTDATWTEDVDSTTWAPYTIAQTFEGQGIYLSRMTGGFSYSDVAASEVAEKVIDGLERIDMEHITVTVPATVTSHSTCDEVDLTLTSVSDTVTGGGVIEFSETIKADTTIPANCEVTFRANGEVISNAVETNNITVLLVAEAVFTATDASGKVVGTATVTYEFDSSGRRVESIDAWRLGTATTV